MLVRELQGLLLWLWLELLEQELLLLVLLLHLLEKQQHLHGARCLKLLPSGRRGAGGAASAPVALPAAAVGVLASPV